MSPHFTSCPGAPWLAGLLSVFIGCGEGARQPRPANGAVSRGGSPASSGEVPAEVKESAGAGGQASSGAAGSCIKPLLREPTVAGSSAQLCDPTLFAAPFTWETSGPILAPTSDATHHLVSIKDPTIVFFDGRWHVYATTASTSSVWNMVYLNFTDWSAAATAPQYYMDKTPGFAGYHCAPQLFYFRPQDKWYLIFQSGPPQFSTADDPAHPETWSMPKNFYATEPETVRTNKGSGTWLDFWVICDDANCYLFFTDDVGHYYRARTTITDFPNGFGEPEVIISDTKENVFEASNVYKLKGTDKYLLLIEAFGPTGSRYFRALTTDRLDGTWAPFADSWTSPFASRTNVTPATCVAKWGEDISHGELLRDNYDETMVVDPCNLTLLYQGVESSKRGLTYSQIPWRLGLLAPKD